MLAKVLSGSSIGLEAVPITVEIDIASVGLPSFTIVGLADRAVEEAKERVRSAIKNIGADFMAKRITVNLAPADLPKAGPLFDLPIALGLLLASGQLISNIDDALVLGELSLDGGLRGVFGVLPLVMLAKKLGYKRVLLPADNAVEAAVVSGIDVYPYTTLLELFQHLNHSIEILPQPPTRLNLEEAETDFEYDFADIKGQETAKRALEIAASGGHNILLKGVPGAGKTLLARTFPSILPPLLPDEALEITKLYSISGQLSKNAPIITRRPFRSPHHTASYVGMIGGGNFIKPGEISLAHRGTLFLDEIPEFSRQVLEALRQPLEDKVVTVSRASGTLTFPAKFILIAACNPCPCGFLGSLTKNCVCLPGQIARYKKKLSGPLLDRVDIHLDVPAVDMEKLTNQQPGEYSKQIRARVLKARKVQLKRFKGSNILTNSEMSNAQIKQFCKLSDEALEILKLAISKMNLSARGYHRVLKLARTIADLADSEMIEQEHVAESLSFRMREED